jgi:hypothetical protein
MRRKSRIEIGIGNHPVFASSVPWFLSFELQYSAIIEAYQ